MAIIEIGVLFLALCTLLGFAYADRRQELRRRKNKALADKLASRLRILESVSLGLSPLYRSSNIESFLRHALQAYVALLLKLRNETVTQALVMDWERRVAALITLPEAGKEVPSFKGGESTQGSEPDSPAVDYRESKYLLKDLHGCILASTQDGMISHSAAQQLVETIKTLIIKVSIDTYDDAANQAEARGDLNLARHCYAMAIKRLPDSPDVKLRSTETVLRQKLRDVQALLDAKSRQSDCTKAPVAGTAERHSEARDEDEDDNSWQKRRF